MLREKVETAFARIKESPADVSAIETLLAVEPRVLKVAGTWFSDTDPTLNAALHWAQSLQPAEVLQASLENGSDTAVEWALLQIVWRNYNDRFEGDNLARLMPGVQMAVSKAPAATRAQAVRTMLVCLPQEEKAGFLKGMLKDQPDEVIATAMENLGKCDPDAEIYATKWLATSDTPSLLCAACSYWRLEKERIPVTVEDTEIAALERIATHPDKTVRRAVMWALQDVTKPIWIPAAEKRDRPRLIGILLRLTYDTDSSVQFDAVRSLRNANTPEVNARLRELFASDPQQAIRRAAIEMLGVFGKENLALVLSAAKTDKDAGVRQMAVMALRTIGTPEAGKGLDAAQHDADAEVRDTARTQFAWYRKEHPSRR